MKKIGLFLVLFFGFTLAAYAHPPSDIKIIFDAKTKMLQAVITHSVSNPLSHYIKKVDIGLNGKEVAELKFSRQDNTDSQSITYLMPEVKDGDVISVEGYCSISGKLQKEIKVNAGK